MVMDHVDGSSLRQIIDDQGPLPVERGIEIAQQVCRALACAHEQGAVHRDVNPSNIRVDAGDHGVLTDSGIAQGPETDEAGLTAAGLAVGTPEYMSPEQVRGDALDGRSDLYSLGIVLYEMFTGELPYAARSRASVMRQQLEKTPDPPRFHNPQLPPALEAVIMKALEKDPRDRYSTAAEMAEALASVLEAGAEWAPEESPPVLSRAGNGTATRTLSIPAQLISPEGGRDTLTGATGGHSLERPTRIGSLEPPTVVTSNGRGASAESGPGKTRFPAFGRQAKILPLILAGVAALALLFFLFQLQGGAGERVTAESSTDPRTGKEYAMVLVHGVPVMIITAPFGELSPAQRAEKAAERLQELLTGPDASEPLEPEMLQAVKNARGEMVLAYRRNDDTDREIDPADVILTVDEGTAKTYANTDRRTLALWWRNLLQDQIRLARGRAPVSTFETPYGKVLDRIYQQVEDRRRGHWVPPADIEDAVESLPKDQRTTLETAWRTLPQDRKNVASLTLTSPNGGETQVIATNRTITWRSSLPPGRVKLEYSSNGGATWLPIYHSTDDTGSAVWTVQGPPTTRARIRITSLTDPSVSDASDRSFIIRSSR
jgi:protein kinase-like protein